MLSTPAAYSTPVGSPVSDDSGPAAATIATPSAATTTPSTRIAVRSNVSDLVVNAVIETFLSRWGLSSAGTGADAATSARSVFAPRVRDGGSGPGGRGSRQTAHPEVLGVGERDGDHGERDRRR